MDTDKQLFDEYYDLIQKHARVAWTKIMKPPKCTLDDLVQEGVQCFLDTKRQFDDSRGIAFRTFLIGCLRKHFTSLVRQSYQDKMSPLLLDNKFLETEVLGYGKSRIPNPLEIVQISFLIQSFNAEEIEYVTAILACTDVPKRSRRKTARKNLRISFEREVKLRNGIRAKIKK